MSTLAASAVDEPSDVPLTVEQYLMLVRSGTLNQLAVADLFPDPPTP